MDSWLPAFLLYLAGACFALGFLIWLWVPQRVRGVLRGSIPPLPHSKPVRRDVWI